MSVTEPVRTPFGAALRRRRLARGWSQLELSLSSRTTSRHVSFLETGRSRASPDMVARLAAALELPLRERNVMFRAAGLAPVYPESTLESDDLTAFRTVVDRMLQSHEPFPAYAVDRHWNIVRSNAAADMFLAASDERNAIRLTYAGPWRDLIDNWDDIAWVGLARLQAEFARLPQDEVLEELVDLATRAVGGVPRPAAGVSGPVLCPNFRIGNDLVRTVSVVAQFGSPMDVTLDELRIELIYPADEDARRFFEGR